MRRQHGKTVDTGKVERKWQRGRPAKTRAQDYKEKLDSKNKSQTQRARAYKVTSFLSTDCDLSTETCSKNVYSPEPWLQDIKAAKVDRQRPGPKTI